MGGLDFNAENLYFCLQSVSSVKGTLNELASALDGIDISSVTLSTAG